MDGVFRVHKDNQMRLEISDDGQYIFIVQNFPNVQSFDIKIWSSQNLKNKSNGDVLKMRRHFDTIQKDRVTNVQLLSTCKFLKIEY